MGRAHGWGRRFLVFSVVLGCFRGQTPGIAL
jgi:hypothetical protein